MGLGLGLGVGLGLGLGVGVELAALVVGAHQPRALTPRRERRAVQAQAELGGDSSHAPRCEHAAGWRGGGLVRDLEQREATELSEVPLA